MPQKVNIFFKQEFGSRGSGNSQFDYPTGIHVNSSNIFIVDKQNHRIQIFDLLGNYIDEFGSYGTGNDNFNFPEAICSDGTDLFIVDGANHRIKKHQYDGTFLLEFGSQGSGNDNFNYPSDIVYNTNKLYIVDKQNHRVKVHLTDGVYDAEFGTYGTGNSNFNFPESIDIYGAKIIVSDSGNKTVKFFDFTGSFLYKTTIIFDYPTGVAVCDTIITILDRQNNELFFIDDNANYISQFGSQGGGEDQFFFPYHAIYLNDLIYITDSANHKVKIFNFIIEDEVPIYTGRLIKLAKQLYPTGRAWGKFRDSILERLHEGLSLSEGRLAELDLGLFNSLIPDNSNFSEIDATNWERALGLYNQANLTIEERKAIILRKMQFPGNIIARQYYLFLERELQLAGFDLYVHENRFGDPPAIVSAFTAYLDTFYLDDTYFGAEGVAIDSIVANNINENLDADFVIGDDYNHRATIFIGGANFGDIGRVPISRKAELRNLILNIKPAQIAALLMLKYTPLENLELEGGGSLELEGGGSLELETY